MTKWICGDRKNTDWHPTKEGFHVFLRKCEGCNSVEIITDNIYACDMHGLSCGCAQGRSCSLSDFMYLERVVGWFRIDMPSVPNNFVLRREQKEVYDPVQPRLKFG